MTSRWCKHESSNQKIVPDMPSKPQQTDKTITKQKYVSLEICWEIRSIKASNLLTLTTYPCSFILKTVTKEKERTASNLSRLVSMSAQTLDLQPHVTLHSQTRIPLEQQQSTYTHGYSQYLHGERGRLLVVVVEEVGHEGGVVRQVLAHPQSYWLTGKRTVALCCLHMDGQTGGAEGWEEEKQEEEWPRHDPLSVWVRHWRWRVVPPHSHPQWAGEGGRGMKRGKEGWDNNRAILLLPHNHTMEICGTHRGVLLLPSPRGVHPVWLQDPHSQPPLSRSVPTGGLWSSA